MTADDIKHTRAWWERLCKDRTAMNAWLQKLQRTELEGARDYYRAISTYLPDLTHHQQANMIHIATDEARHATMIRAVLLARGVTPLSKDEAPPSAYWQEMFKHMVCVRTFAAANYFGESLAAQRFHHIMMHPATPADIRTLISCILPDEQAHANMLGRMAGEDYINAMEVHHDNAVRLIKEKK